jgi:hypothetical protein
MNKFKVLLRIRGRKFEWIKIYSSGRRMAESDSRTDWKGYPGIFVLYAKKCGSREFEKLDFIPEHLNRKWHSGKYLSKKKRQR